MDISLAYQETLKIAGKNGYVLFNPQTVDDAKIVIVDDNNPANFDDESLCIYGPGEYEAGGIVVKGTRQEGSTMYTIDIGEGKALHLLSDSISKLSDEDDISAVIIRAVTPIEEAKLATIPSAVTIVYGDASNIPDKVRENTVNKVSMKKKEDLPGNIVYLVKK